MFRSLSGSKAQYHYLTALVISEFNEWRVMVYAPGTTIHGTRQFSENDARQHAIAVARSYIHDEKHEDLPEPPDVTWQPSSPEDWLVWR